MAIYGVSHYGSPTTYGDGSPVQLQFAASKFTAIPQSYGQLYVSWSPPGGSWTNVALVRSTFGYPTDFVDGTVLFTDPSSNARLNYLDDDLQEGRFYYYTLFVYLSALGVWQVAGNCTGLVTQDFGTGSRMYELLPEIDREKDLDYTDSSGNGQLYRFLQLFGYQFDVLRTEAQTLLKTYDIDLVAGGLLPLLASSFGVTYETELGMITTRSLIRNAIHLTKVKGTKLGLEGLASSITSYGASVADGKNLMLSRSDANFEYDIGTWVALTNCTVAHDVVSAQDGTASLKVTASGNGDATVGFAITDVVHLGVPVDEGAVYSASLYAKQGA